MTYVFGLSDGTVIDGSEGGNALRHLNHSCEPNCVAYEVADAQARIDIRIETLRAIAPTEELLLDYALDIGSGVPAEFACACRASTCRGTLAAAATGSTD